MNCAILRLIWVSVTASAMSAVALPNQDPGSSKRWIVYAGERDAITTTLSADRAVCYLGEAVRLSLVVRNETEEPLVGFFATVRGSEVHYRRIGGAFARFTGASREEQVWAERRHGLRAPVQLDPGQERKAEFLLAIHGTGRLVLDEPGEYEFKIVSHPAPKNPDLAVESNVVLVHVESVPNSQREAFADYAGKRLGAVIQSPGWVTQKDPTTVSAAADFVERYPHSPYAREVRKELVRALRARVLQNRASKEERGIYQKLKDAEPQGQ